MLESAFITRFHITQRKMPHRRLIIRFRDFGGNWLLIAALLLALVGAAYFRKGTSCAWQNLDHDFQSRRVEYASFASGVYPNYRLVSRGSQHSQVHSVYPPYAFPMFFPLYFWKSQDFQRLLIEWTSVVGIVCMMVLGFRSLAPYGPKAALLGSILPAAFSGNCSAVALGQLSIICMGLVSLQIMLMEKRRHIAAGLCWAFAMIKPQIGLPFALLFITAEKAWMGLLAGVTLLVLLSGGALAWTGISPVSFIRNGLLTESYSFLKGKSAYAGGLLVKLTGTSPWFFMIAGLLIVVGTAILLIILRKRIALPLLTYAGIASVLGFVLFYHLHYDNIMLYPLLLTILIRIFNGARRWSDLLIASLLCFMIYAPASLIAKHQVMNALSILVFLASAGLVLVPIRNASDKRMIN